MTDANEDPVLTQNYIAEKTRSKDIEGIRLKSNLLI